MTNQNQPKLIEKAPVIDDILTAHLEYIGRDFDAYRNHCYRVLNFCTALCGENDEKLSKVSIAVAFHDLGIWTKRTFDYLGPSILLARDYLAKTGHSDWSDEIGTMIDQHHKLRRYRPHPEWLVESFRKADWIDVSLGILKFSMPAAFISEVRSKFPNAGFHKRLIMLTFERMKNHPFSPLPMMKF